MGKYLAAMLLALGCSVAHGTGLTMVSESGTCADLEMPGAPRAATTKLCFGKIVNAVLPNGRVVFTFSTVPSAQSDVLSFAGSGREQLKRSPDMAVQPVDSVDLTIGGGSTHHLKASGRCTFDNPYKDAGAAYVRCTARTSVGLFAARLASARASDRITGAELSRPPRGRRARVFIAGPALTGDTIPLRSVNTILFLSAPCPLSIVGASHMRRAWEDQGAYQLGCWYPTIGDGYVYIDGAGEVFPTSMSPRMLPRAVVNADGSATITEPDYNSATWIAKESSRLETQALKELAAARNEKP